MKLLTKERYSFRQTSINFSSVLEQFDRVLPDTPFFRQLMPTPSSRPTSSYCELIIMKRPWTKAKEFCRKRQRYSSPSNRELQEVRGVKAFALETLNSAFDCSENVYSPVYGLVIFIKTPESATVYKAFGSVSRLLTQLLHEKVAIPPEEAPVSRTFSALAN